MKTITSTEARQSFSSVISEVENEPVSISKQHKEVAVIISSAGYKELKKIEDILYGSELRNYLCNAEDGKKTSKMLN